MRTLCLSMVFRVLLLAFGLMLSGPRATARAEDATAIIIFDGSGSMWGRLDQERGNKLSAAREGVRQGLARIAPATRVGLMSFGHRRGGDCQDTETIIEPAPLNLERITGVLEKLNPRGRGPLTRALKEAAPRIKTAGAATVVLIHDGADNCQLDPCSAIGELKASNPLVRVDVVSVGVPPDEAQTVACLARETGGKHYLASTVADLDAALLESMSRAAPGTRQGPTAAAPAAKPLRQQADAAPVPAPVAPPAPPGLQLWTSLTKGGPPLDLPVRWTVRKSGQKGAPLWQGETSAPLLILPTGRYDVEARVGLITRTGTADAVEDQPRSLGLVLDAGTLTLAQGSGTRAMLSGAIVTLSRIEAKGPVDPLILRHADPELALPAGNYLIALTEGALRIERPVGIVAGERLSIASALSLGALELTAVASKDGPPLDGIVYAVYEDDPDAPQGRREIARTAAAAPRLKIPAGTYYVVARRGAAEVRDRVSVKSGEVERRTLVLDTGNISVSVQIAGGKVDSEAPIVHRLQRIDVQPPEVVNASGAAVSVDLAAGQYRMETRVGLGNARMERELRVKPGEAEKVSFLLSAGGARFRLLENAAAKPMPDVGFEVRDKAGQVVWSGLGAEPRALLMAGRYTVRAEGRGVVAERVFDIVPGDERAVDLTIR